MNFTKMLEGLLNQQVPPLNQAWNGSQPFSRDVSGNVPLSNESSPIRWARSWVAGALAVGLTFALAAQDELPTKADQLYQTDKVWTVHFHFKADQWEKMEPESGPGGGPFGPGGGGPGAGGRPGGPPMGGGPFGLIAPAIIKHGDTTSDGALSREEFDTLATRWFGEWDKDKTGSLTEEQLREGLNSVIEMPAIAFGGPGGGRGGGMRLQGAEGRRNGLAGAMGIEFEFVQADIEFAGHTFTNVSVRYKGNGTFMQSRNELKKSLKVDLNKNVKGQKLAGFTKLNFHSCVTDASWMNEVLSYQLYRDAGVPAPRTAFAEVYLTVESLHERTFVGLYSLVENVDNNFADDRFGTKKGAIFKPVTPALFDYMGEAWSDYNQTYDPKTDLTVAQSARVMEFSKLNTQASDDVYLAEVGKYLDLPALARYMAVTVWLSTMDSILSVGQNYHMYLDRDSNKFQITPWDLDHSFGQFPMIGTQEAREQLSLMRPWTGQNRFLERLFAVEDFKKLYSEEMGRIHKTLAQPDRIGKQVDALAAVIRPSIEKEDAEKLTRFDAVVAGQPAPPSSRGFGGFGGFGGPRSSAPEEARDSEGSDRRGPGPGEVGGRGRGGGGGFGGFGGFGAPVKPIKGFAQARFESVGAQLAGTSEGQQIVGGFGGGGGPRGGGPGGPGAGSGGFGGPPGGGGPRGFGGPGGFGPGTFLGGVFLQSLDADKDGQVTRDEFFGGFGRWFEKWDIDGSGKLTNEQLRAGIDSDLVPFGGRGWGPPPSPESRPDPAPGPVRGPRR